MVYSPFRPYFHWSRYKGNVQNCWVAADCVFEAAGESRKQQFAAVALVMGLLPLTLRDVAWPARRIVHVTKRTRRLNWLVEVLVLALGLVPVETNSARQKSKDENSIIKAFWRMRKSGLVLSIIACATILLACLAGMFFMELYSKRSALGCPYPAFVVSWYIAALLPAIIHSLFARLRRRRSHRKNCTVSPTVQHYPSITATDNHPSKRQETHSREDRQEYGERETKADSAVQGADEDWPVQLSWGLYYIGGTLIFTSIMAVTVIELICWVGLCCALTATSKLLAFFLCLVFEEDTGELELPNADGRVKLNDLGSVPL